MPAKKRCQAKFLVTSPPLPSAAQQPVPVKPAPPSTTTTIAANAAGAGAIDTTTSTGGQNKDAGAGAGAGVELKDLPATQGSQTEIRCDKAAVRVVGECGYCGGHFCGGHRLPEQHFCSNLQACRDAAYSLNKAKLESEKTVARKVGEV